MGAGAEALSRSVPKCETGAKWAIPPTARPSSGSFSYFLAAKTALTVNVAEPPSGAGNVIE
jgi:hypothetical protein